MICSFRRLVCVVLGVFRRRCSFVFMFLSAASLLRPQVWCCCFFRVLPLLSPTQSPESIFMGLSYTASPTFRNLFVVCVLIVDLQAGGLKVLVRRFSLPFPRPRKRPSHLSSVPPAGAFFPRLPLPPPPAILHDLSLTLPVLSPPFLS